jgi:hypothetical protein
VRLAVVGDADAAGLAGLDGSFDWGEAITAAPGAVPDADVAVELTTAGLRVTAGGTELATRTPWPAREELYDLPAPPGPRVLVAGPEAARAEVVTKLRGRSLPVAEADRLDAAGLAGASVVALLGEPDGDALPPEAPAVLAARRVLIAPRRPITFGLLAGTDHLAFDTGDDVVQYADTALTFPDSLDVFRVFGALTARQHRAPVAYGRIAVTAALRSAARRG